jgi:hypothetical protein
MTLKGIRNARRRYKVIAAGDLFYRAALVLVAASYERNRQLDLAESVALLLQTWNKDFYIRYLRRSFDETDFKGLRTLLKRHAKELETFRFRRLDSFDTDDVPAVHHVFSEFEHVLGPVGAAKALHLLAPAFFPIWDRKIAKGVYKISLRGIGQNADNYLRLMKLTLDQVQRLGGWDAIDRAPLKAIDEFNYVIYTKSQTAAASGR